MRIKLLNIWKNETMRSSIGIMLIKGSGILLGYILTIVISGKFGPAGLGIYSIAFTSVIIYGHIASLGLNTSILRYMGQYGGEEESKKRGKLYLYALKIIFVTSLLLSGLLYTFSRDMAIYVFQDAEYVRTLHVVALMSPFFTLNLINVEYMRGMNNTNLSELFRTVCIPGITIMLLWFLWTGSDIQLPVYAVALTTALVSLISFGTVFSAIFREVRGKINDFKLSNLLKTSFPMMLVTLGSYFMGNMSVYIIQVISGTIEVGIFALCLKLSLFISFVLIGVNTVIAPQLSQLYWSGQQDRLAHLVRSNTKFIFWLSLVPFVILICIPGWLLHTIGEEFIAGKWTLVLLSAGQFINAFCGPVGLLLNMTGHQNVLMRVTLITLLITLFLNVVLTQWYGILGAAWATAVSIAIKNIILVIVTKRRLQINTVYFPFYG